MGHIKTQKQDNNTILFECIYGGVEAPFGGIDASKPPRYIDPRCFADASNFLIVDNELCVATLVSANFPSNGLTYPYAVTLTPSITDPADLIGVGTLPCEGIVKNWALYCSSAINSGGYYTYRLILWTNDTSTVESHDFQVHADTVPIAGQQATATLTVSWKGAPVVPTLPNSSTPTPWISSPASPPYTPGPPSGPGVDGLIYEVDYWNVGINAPTGYASNFLTNFYAYYPPSSGTGPTHPPTITDLITPLISDINGWSNAPFKATAGPGPNQITLTAFTQSGLTSVDGAAGNSITLDGTQPYVGGFGWYTAPAASLFHNGAFTTTSTSGFYQPPNPFTIPAFLISSTPFTGGRDAGSYVNKPIQNLTWETIGDQLFLAGWPAGYMLQYSNTFKSFTYLTQYEGARVLKKFMGHLISVGVIDGVGTLASGPTLDPHLIFSWSAEGNYYEWNPLDATSLVTGAGFSQLADISDMLTGLVIANSVAFILRAEGLSYAQVQTSASLPFEFNHVDLTKEGQGCPSTSLWTQFDQLGFYVGSSNVFVLSQSPQAVGDKILKKLYPDLVLASNYPNPPGFQDSAYNDTNVEPLTILINQRPITFFSVNINGTLYVFSPQDGAWMKLNTLPAYPVWSGVGKGVTYNIMKCISLPTDGIMGYGGSFQYKSSYMYIQQVQRTGLSFALQAPLLYQFVPQVSPQQSCYVTFPAEEISHGRDITIDAVYATVSGIPGVVVNMYVSGWQRDQQGVSSYVSNVFIGQITLDANADPRQYEEYQFFNIDGSAITLKAPQLQMFVSSQTPPTWTPPITAPYPGYPYDSNPQFKCSKISMLGSFDPNQRPA